jgi:hypothetical protein
MSLDAIKNVANNCLLDEHVTVVVDCDIKNDEDKMLIEVSSDAPESLKLQLAILAEGMINTLARIKRDIGDSDMIEELRATLEYIPQRVYSTTYEEVKDDESLSQVKEIADKYQRKQPKK